MESFGITSVPGIRVGHYTDRRNATGCTVVVCETGAVGGVDVRGSSPGSRETDLLRPENQVSEVHAILLSGGSAFGLDAASGVVRYLEENGIGLRFGGASIPIVPGAILFDLGVVTHRVRPGPEQGYMAARIASAGVVAEGSLGAGTGATVGKFLGMEHAVKGGIGTASLDLGNGLNLGALVAVNAVGGVHDPATGDLIAGPRDEDGSTMRDSVELFTSPSSLPADVPSASNTTIGVVATNARLDKQQVGKIASVAHDGLALAVRPAHTVRDGDIMFGLAVGTWEAEANLDRLCATAALCVSRAIVRAVQKAEGIGGIPSVRDLARGAV